jgi:hypothetical protein
LPFLTGIPMLKKRDSNEGDRGRLTRRPETIVEEVLTI